MTERERALACRIAYLEGEVKALEDTLEDLGPVVADRNLAYQLLEESNKRMQAMAIELATQLLLVDHLKGERKRA